MIKLGLGTAQFGVPYGNMRDKELMPIENVVEIVEFACDSGITFFDTAVAYGESEVRLGKIAELRNSKYEVVTKIPPAANWRDADGYLEFGLNAVKESLQKLNFERFGLLMFHQCQVDFLHSKSFEKLCLELKLQGICNDFGVSVYQPEEALAASCLPWVNALQIPVNIIDNRFVDGEVLKSLVSRNIRLISRSVVLQGVLHEKADLPNVRKRHLLEELRTRCQEIARRCETDLQSLAFAHVFHGLNEVLDVGLIGVDSLDSLKENMSLACKPPRISREESDSLFEGVRSWANFFQLNNPATWDR